MGTCLYCLSRPATVPLTGTRILVICKPCYEEAKASEEAEAARRDREMRDDENRLMPALRVFARQRQSALEATERSIKGALLDAPPALPPLHGQLVDALGEGLDDQLFDEWHDAAQTRLESLGKTKGLVAAAAAFTAPEIRLKFLEVRFDPIPLVTVRATVAMTAAVEVVVANEDGWSLDARTSGGMWVSEEIPEVGSLGFLSQPVSVTKRLGTVSVPLAILIALGRDDLRAPGAEPIALGVGGFTWRCNVQEFTLQPWLFRLLHCLTLEDSLYLLGMPDALRQAATSALQGGTQGGTLMVSESQGSKLLGQSLEGPRQEVKEEAVQALVSLGVHQQQARTLVDRVADGLPVDASSEEIIRLGLQSRG